MELPASVTSGATPPPAQRPPPDPKPGNTSRFRAEQTAPPQQLQQPRLDANNTTPRKGFRFGVMHSKQAQEPASGPNTGGTAETLREMFYFGEAYSHNRSPPSKLPAKQEPDIPSLCGSSRAALWGPRCPSLWHRQMRMADAGTGLFCR